MAFAQTTQETAGDTPRSVSYNDNYVAEYYAPDPVKFYDPPEWTLSSCIETGKWILGKQGQKWGNANKLDPVEGLLPAPGLIGITNEGLGHVFIIQSVLGPVLNVLEGNFKPGQLSTRSLNIDDPRIKGYWQPESL